MTEEDLVMLTEELRCQAEVDTGTKTELQDSVGPRLGMCYEADVIFEQTRLQ